MAGVFGFATVGHFFAAAFNDLQKALTFAGDAGAKLEGAANKVETMTALLPNSSKAVEVERAAFSSLGVLLSAVAATSAAVSSDGLNVKLDAAMVTALRALLTDVKSDLAVLGYRF